MPELILLMAVTIQALHSHRRFMTVQIKFQIEDFKDALYFTDEEYAALTENDIETMKQARFLAWQEIVATTYQE